jgi:hypothetical protein
MGTKKLERQLRSEFPYADIGHTGSGHFKITLPNGKVVTASATPSDEGHTLRNIRADVKRKMEDRR